MEQMRGGKVFLGAVEEMIYKKKMIKILKDIGEIPKDIDRAEFDQWVARGERVIGFSKEDRVILFWHEETGDEASYFLNKADGKWKIYYMSL